MTASQQDMMLNCDEFRAPNMMAPDQLMSSASHARQCVELWFAGRPTPFSTVTSAGLQGTPDFWGEDAWWYVQLL